MLLVGNNFSTSNSDQWSLVRKNKLHTVPCVTRWVKYSHKVTPIIKYAINASYWKCRNFSKVILTVAISTYFIFQLSSCTCLYNTEIFHFVVDFISCWYIIMKNVLIPHITRCFIFWNISRFRVVFQLYEPQSQAVTYMLSAPVVSTLIMNTW